VVALEMDDDQMSDPVIYEGDEHDVQARDCGDEEPFDISPLGTPETKPERLGFMERRSKQLSRYERLKRFFRRKILRIRR